MPIINSWDIPYEITDWGSTEYSLGISIIHSRSKDFDLELRNMVVGRVSVYPPRRGVGLSEEIQDLCEAVLELEESETIAFIQILAEKEKQFRSKPDGTISL